MREKATLSTALNVILRLMLNGQWYREWPKQVPLLFVTLVTYLYLRKKKRLPMLPVLPLLPLLTLCKEKLKRVRPARPLSVEMFL